MCRWTPSAQPRPPRSQPRRGASATTCTRSTPVFSPEAGAAFVDVIIPAALHAVPYDEPELAEPYLRRRRALAQERHAGEYVLAAELLHRESREVVAQWRRDFDVLLTPTMACLPPEAGVVLPAANRDPLGFRLTELQMITFTFFCNITGLPAISLPVHTAVDGLPVGAQLVGAPFAEATLIRLASSVEAKFGWTSTVPSHLR